jgi:hypothetical protein
MYEKHNRFYADWRDKRGNRKRKAFLTAKDAERYELEQKAKARPKTQGAARPSTISSVPTTPRGSSKKTKPDHTQSTQHSNSSSAREKSQSRISRAQTLRKSAKRGGATALALATRERTHSKESFVGSRRSTQHRDSTTRSRKRSCQHHETSQRRTAKEKHS